MAFLIGGANSDSGAYQIDNSGLFNGSSQYINKTYSSEESVLTKWTLSAWVKRGNLSNGSDHQYFFQAGDYSIVGFRDDNTLMVQVYNSDGGGKAILTNAKYRDVGAWYHIVAEYDSTDGTAANRLKLYVNGEEVTSFGTDQRSSISQNDDDLVGDDVAHTIGYGSNNTSYFDGYMADVHVICGNHYPASYFGETNDNGVWVPKKFTGNFGSNGSFHEFGAQSTGVGAGRFASDTSGNGNHYDTNNFSGEYQMEDTPTNNFCTLNPLNPTESNASFSKGNLAFTNSLNSSPHHALANGTIAVASGKWYWEVKCEAVGGTAMSIGAHEVSEFSKNDFTGDNGVGYFNNGNFHYRGTEDSDPNTYTTNDIIGVALDMDNRAIYFHKNGTYEDSGDPTSGSSRTGAAGGALHASNVTMTPAVSNYNNGNNELNFGSNIYSISSGNADANGYGNFEYAVPSGYYALCTKNLAEFG